MVALVVASVVAAACGGGDDEPLGPTATVPQGTTTTDPYAVPAVIDEAYVNRVLAGLDQVYGDALRLVVASRTLPGDALARVESVYAGDVLKAVRASINATASGDQATFAQPPGNRITTVVQLLEANPACIFAEISRDYRNVTNDEYDAEPVSQWVVLRPGATYGIATGYNATGWVYTFDGVDEDGTGPEVPCPAS